MARPASHGGEGATVDQPPLKPMNAPQNFFTALMSRFWFQCCMWFLFLTSALLLGVIR